MAAWIAAAGISAVKKSPLFRSFKKGDKRTDNAMIRSDVLYMIKPELVSFELDAIETVITSMTSAKSCGQRIPSW
jgi:hypothetical protein